MKNLNKANSPQLETRQTGSEGWELKLEKFYTIGYNFSTKNSRCLSCTDSVNETHYCPEPTRERPGFETIRNFIRDLLAAQKEEMKNEINSYKAESASWEMAAQGIKEAESKQIIEAVELVEKMVKEASQSFIDVSNRMQDPSFPLHYMDVVVAKEILEKLAQFKREYGGRE